MSSTEAWMTPDAATFSRNGASWRAYPRYYIGDATGHASRGFQGAAEKAAARSRGCWLGDTARRIA